MPNNYQRKRGSRAYQNYTDETLSRAIDEIRKGLKSIRKASLTYKIPRSTLANKILHRHKKSAGGQTRLSDQCETMIVSALNILTKWKVPLTGIEIRLLVKNYLDALALPTEVFSKNMPGHVWLRKFMRRHNLTKRKADNVSVSRGRLSDDTVNSYFDHLEKELVGVPPANVFNYDETNLSDDPGTQHVIVHRGLRRVERIIEHSRSSTSVMFCGNAAGTYLPPMIVYKCGSESLFSNWVGPNGPKNAEYGSTKSGWFNKRTFSQWFFNIFLPFVSKLNGPTVLIGDNLGSHFSHDVIEATITHDIRFITMPPSSTHICQPLDVAVFRTLKLHWRNILDDFRKTTRQTGVVPKVRIPGLLSKLCSKLTPDHLKSGFRATGLHPTNRDQVLKRLRGGGMSKTTTEDDLDKSVFSQSIIGMLETNCGQAGKDSKRLKRGRKITYGKRIVTLDSNKNNSEWLEKNCWFCEQEDGERDDGDIWIGCDHCDKWYHLQCSGIEYIEEEYYTLDVSSIEFDCKNH